MHILPISTPLLRQGDDLAGILRESIDVQDGDVLIVSSKAVATCDGFGYELRKLDVSDEANASAVKSNRSPEFCEAVLRETRRLNGRVVGHCPGAMLTELRPDGLQKGVLLVPNAGLDESNVPDGWAIGWPENSVKSASALRAAFAPKKIAVIITDSRCTPWRWGVTAMALTVSGIAAYHSEIGNKDLYGRTLRITAEALADQLATAGNMVMGNASQSTPATIVRDHGFALSDEEGWVPGIEPEMDLFREVLRQ